jgi:hypothetical protein
MTKLNDIYNWAAQHKAALALAAGWFVHMGWPKVVSSGGIVGLMKTFLFGKPFTPINLSISPDSPADKTKEKQ